MADHKGIYKRKDTANFWIRYTGVDGRQARESSNSDKIGVAIKLLRLRQGEIVKGEEPEIITVKNAKFKDLAQDYLDFIKASKTYKKRKTRVDALVVKFGNLPLKNFNTKLLEKYQSELLSTERSPLKGTISTRPPVKESTVNRKMALIKAMFTKAHDWHMISDSGKKELSKVKQFKENNKRVRFLASEEITDLITACESNVISLKTGEPIKLKQSHLKPIVICALNTGCRKEEILSLKWDQVDMKHGFIHLNKTKIDESRQIPISHVLKSVLEELPKEKDCPYVFIAHNSSGRVGDPKKSFATACRKAGITNFHFHDLRHTFASHLVMSGVDITTVSKLLGHKSLTMTLRYAHLAPNHLTMAVNVLNSSMAFHQPKPVQADKPSGTLIQLHSKQN
ncbi:MAG: site-specific integrase [Deltaproteobacteria bacterium]